MSQIKDIKKLPEDELNQENQIDEQSFGDSEGRAEGFKGIEDKRKQWLPEEDLLINVFVDKFGTKKWNIIAEQLKKRILGSNRNGK